jgi:hypothetical protein
MIRSHLIAYTATTDGTTTKGVAPVFTLRYTVDGNACSREVDAASIDKVGALVMRLAEAGRATDIQVTDASGNDVTFDFPVFCA